MHDRYRLGAAWLVAFVLCSGLFAPPIGICIGASRIF